MSVGGLFEHLDRVKLVLLLGVFVPVVVLVLAIVEARPVVGVLRVQLGSWDRGELSVYGPTKVEADPVSFQVD